MMSSMMSLLHLFQTSSQKGCKSHFLFSLLLFSLNPLPPKSRIISISLITFLGFFPTPNVYKESLISTKKIESRSQFSHTITQHPYHTPLSLSSLSLEEIAVTPNTIFYSYSLLPKPVPGQAGTASTRLRQLKFKVTHCLSQSLAVIHFPTVGKVYHIW